MNEPALNQLSRRMTFEEWGELEEDEEGELVDGVLVEEEVPTFVHEALVAMLVALFRTWLGPGRGAVGGSEVKFKVSQRRGRKPDLFVYLPGSRLPPGRASVIDLPPDIMIEVVSQRPRDQRLDRVEKLSEYSQFGVRYYWLVDTELRSFQILELGPDGRYAHAVDVTSGRVEPAPGCPGLSVDVDALWAEVERLEATNEDGQ
jgi:Uma2 family endonuclease